MGSRRLDSSDAVPFNPHRLVLKHPAAVHPDGLVVFVVVYAALRIAGGGLARGIQSAQVLGILDRTVGLGFGLLRALVVLGALHLAFNAATPPVSFRGSESTFYGLGGSIDAFTNLANVSGLTGAPTTTTNGVPVCVCFDGDDADLQQQQLYVYTSIEALLS